MERLPGQMLPSYVNSILDVDKAIGLYTAEAISYVCEVLVSQEDTPTVLIAARSWLPILVREACSGVYTLTTKAYHPASNNIIASLVSAATTIMEVVMEDAGLFREVFPMWWNTLVVALRLRTHHPALGPNMLSAAIVSLRYTVVKCMQAFMCDSTLPGTRYVACMAASSCVHAASWLCLCTCVPVCPTHIPATLPRSLRETVIKWLTGSCKLKTTSKPDWPTIRRGTAPWGSAGVVTREYHVVFLPTQADIAASIRYAGCECSVPRRCALIVCACVGGWVCNNQRFRGPCCGTGPTAHTRVPAPVMGASIPACTPRHTGPHQLREDAVCARNPVFSDLRRGCVHEV